MSDAFTWHFCAAFDDLSENRLTEIYVAEKRLCVLKRAGRVLAFAATCPHAGAPLCEGRVDVQGRVICPLHGYRFDPANGYNSSGEGYKLKTYPVKEEDGRIFVQF